MKQKYNSMKRKYEQRKYMKFKVKTHPLQYGWLNFIDETLRKWFGANENSYLYTYNWRALFRSKQYLLRRWYADRRSNA